MKDFEKVLEFNIFQTEFDDKSSPNQTGKYVNLTECDPNDYGIHKDFVEKKISSNPKLKPYCIKYFDSLNVKNDYIPSSSRIITFNVKACNTSVIGNTCYSEDEVKRRTSLPIYISLITINSFLDTSNFNDPIKYFEDGFTVTVSNQFSKRRYILFSKNQLLTDAGLVFEDQSIKEYISIKSMNSDINSFYSNLLFTFSFHSTTTITYTTRSYMKIQDLFAKIGGFFKFITIIAKLFASSIINFEYYKLIYDKSMTKIKQNNQNDNIFDNSVKSDLKLNENIKINNLIDENENKNKNDKEDNMEKREKIIVLERKENPEDKKNVFVNEISIIDYYLSYICLCHSKYKRIQETNSYLFKFASDRLSIEFI